MIARALCAALSAALLAACSSTTTSQLRVADERCDVPQGDPVSLVGGTFMMGDGAVYPEEEPRRRVRVGDFWMDRHEVTNIQFAEFVDATGYKTVAERSVDPAAFGVPESQIPEDLLKPGSAVFRAPDTPPRTYNDWWTYVPGAYWLRPFGPDNLTARRNEPVVHLAWEDMAAFAEWKGGRLPTEAEWEFAAVAGAPASTSPPKEANTWQGIFPMANTEADGFSEVAPVGCFEPNSNGLYDMIGNVWEMTGDAYRLNHNGPIMSEQPHNSDNSDLGIPRRRTIKGGSYLCAENYCQRYRPAARQAHDASLGMGHVGFRLVYDRDPTG